MLDILSALAALVNYANIILIISGVILFLDILEWKKSKEEWKWKLKLLAVVGFILGIIDLIVVASGWSRGVMDTATIILFILAGLALTLAPTVQLPLAGLLALGVGGVAAFYISGFIHNTWIIAAVFIIIVAVIFLFAKAVEEVLDLLGKILGFPLISMILGSLCVLQGVLLLLGSSLILII
ncbi:MAG: hypothetical protein OdinLCB4_006225 [Candidatus Odinarchaeum yellowstonii]|jgi:hypothetical protein|uniref:Uncharacterized protein n=1 Tax=Odinarchaeota yellowstonii (strain LCB_4) TaxID=1841599 RepID=A0AAF0D1Q3_ODILC|nr:MAG: hypothetical protein OdinLCB4_006225 [Candidatus Odinarchaeum yellowstonii]